MLAVIAALGNGDILIIFPEGSRGKPEQISKIRKGLFYLTKNRDDVSITPIIMHGLGKSLPRGEALFVPFNCDVIIGDKMPSTYDSQDFIKTLLERFDNLFQYCITKNDIA